MADDVKPPEPASPEVEFKFEPLDRAGQPTQQVGLPDINVAAQGRFEDAQDKLEEHAYFESLLSTGEFELRRERWGLVRLFFMTSAVGAGVGLLWWLFAGRRA